MTRVFSIDFINKDNGMVAYELSKKYVIMTRSGLHCPSSALIYRKKVKYWNLMNWKVF